MKLENNTMLRVGSVVPTESGLYCIEGFLILPLTQHLRMISKIVSYLLQKLVIRFQYVWEPQSITSQLPWDCFVSRGKFIRQGKIDATYPLQSAYWSIFIHSFLYQLFVKCLLDAKHYKVFAIKEKLGPDALQLKLLRVYLVARCKLFIKVIFQNLRFNIYNEKKMDTRIFLIII